MEDLFFSSISRESLKETVLEGFKDHVTPYIYKLINVRDETEIITKKEAVKFLKVSEKTIEEWTKRGIVTAHRVGTRVRYKKSELEGCLTPINFKTTFYNH